MPQQEGGEKQAGWVKKSKWGEMPQPEGGEKQAGWGKIGGIGKMPQSEDKIKREQVLVA